MARDFALHLYKSAAWARNRKNYLNALVDTSGHVLRTRDGADGPEYYWVDEYGYEVKVNSSSIVPPLMCERCFAQGRLVPAKVVHHVVWLTPENVDDPHISLSYDNFQRLCQDCHAAVHAGTDESRVTFDASGNVVWKEGM